MASGLCGCNSQLIFRSWRVQRSIHIQVSVVDESLELEKWNSFHSKLWMKGRPLDDGPYQYPQMRKIRSFQRNRWKNLCSSDSLWWYFNGLRYGIRGYRGVIVSDHRWEWMYAETGDKKLRRCYQAGAIWILIYLTTILASQVTRLILSVLSGNTSPNSDSKCKMSQFVGSDPQNVSLKVRSSQPDNEQRSS